MDLKGTELIIYTYDGQPKNTYNIGVVSKSAIRKVRKSELRDGCSGREWTLCFCYWDGHNHQKWLLEYLDSPITAAILNTESFPIPEDEAKFIIKKIKSAFKKYDTYIQNGFCKSENIDGYDIHNSRMQDDPFIAYMEDVNIGYPCIELS